MKKTKIVVFSGAGLSEESGISTFRDSGGLWENYEIEDVATPAAWSKNPQLVQDFYNMRRKQIIEVSPNQAHLIIATWQDKYDVQVITQNIDDLHERAGSKNVLHLHGIITKSQSSINPNLTYDIDGWELKMGDKCAHGTQLRPHVVWFGEAVPMIPVAQSIIQTADIFIVIGTSLQVYPAAALIYDAPTNSRKILIDPNANEHPGFEIIKKTASEGLMMLKL